MASDDWPPRVLRAVDELNAAVYGAKAKPRASLAIWMDDPLLKAAAIEIRRLRAKLESQGDLETLF